MQTTLLIIGLVIAVFITFRVIMMKKMKNTPLVDNHERVLTLTDANFQHQTKNKIVLVDFWASWCAPCRMMAPVLNDVSSKLTGNAYVGKVDIQQYQALGTKHKVRNIPTLILLKNGKEVNRFVGIKTKDFLLTEIEKIS